MHTHNQYVTCLITARAQIVALVIFVDAGYMITCVSVHTWVFLVLISQIKSSSQDREKT